MGCKNAFKVQNIGPVTVGRRGALAQLHLYFSFD